MAYTTIDKPTDYFNTKLYTGNGSTQSITGVGFQPDLVWGKSRSLTEGNSWNDVVRGATKSILSNSTAAEETISGVTSFDSDGFSLGSNAHMNASSSSMVSWNWKESATAGFDIVAHTGNSSNHTVAHSLSAVPEVMISKNRSTTSQWQVYTKVVGNGKALQLSGASAADTSSTYYNNTTPTSSVFTVGTDTGTNGNGNSMIVYLFRSVQGYSKFGSYTGNGSTDGTFVYTGFKPALVIQKSTAAGNWRMYDNKRLGYNPDQNASLPNAASAEETNNELDILSNGFKFRTADGQINGSGVSYIYMCFASNPLVTSTGVPATAR